MSWWFKKSSSTQQQNPSGPSPSHSSSYHHQDSNDSDDGAVNIIISRVNTSSPETSNNNYFNTLINGLKKRLKMNSDDNRKYWMPDTCSNECYECGNKFTTIRRRHHCRICGQIFCNKCCDEEIDGKLIGSHGYVRACSYCFKIVIAYINDKGMTNDSKLNEFPNEITDLLIANHFESDDDSLNNSSISDEVNSSPVSFNYIINLSFNYIINLSFNCIINFNIND